MAQEAYRKPDSSGTRLAMREDLEVLKGYIESLGLHEKKPITKEDMLELKNTLSDADETGLANCVGNLKSPQELEDFIVDVMDN